MSLNFKQMSVTPALAEKWLKQTEAAGFINRSLKHAAIDKYAHDMREGVYFGALTGETIKFAKKDGVVVVIDGQNRLSAVVRSGTTQDFIACTYVDLEMFKYIDGGQPRSLEDLMSIDGSPLSTFAKMYAVTGYMLYKEDHTGDPRRRPSDGEASGLGTVLEYIKANYLSTGPREKGMTDLVPFHKAALSKIQGKGLGPASMWAYVLVRAHAQDPLMAEKMIEYFSTFGEAAPFSKNLFLCAERIIALRKEAEGEAKKVVKGRHQDFISQVLESIVVAWNLTREGMHLRAAGAYTKKVNDLGGSWPGFL